jgi:hypothetical protein
MSGEIGVVCKKDGFGYTHVVDGVATDYDISVPSNIRQRGAQLSWILEEAERLITNHKPERLCVQRAAGGGKASTSPERLEVEGLLQVAAHRKTCAYSMLTRDQVRAAFGVARSPGAYDILLQRDDVAQRSNAQRRDQYLLALVPQK